MVLKSLQPSLVDAAMVQAMEAASGGEGGVQSGVPHLGRTREPVTLDKESASDRQTQTQDGAESECYSYVQASDF